MLRCMTLVDRIVPGFPRKEIDSIKEELQYNDNLVVQAEIFHLWVIEAPESVAKDHAADSGHSIGNSRTV